MATKIKQGKYYCDTCEKVIDYKTRWQTTCKWCGDLITKNLFDSMYEYCEDADISNYYMNQQNNNNIIYIKFKPLSDSNLGIDYSNVIRYNGKDYIRICWGESSYSYIKESAIEECCYIRYVLKDNTLYISDGIVYETLNDAMTVDL